MNQSKIVTQMNYDPAVYEGRGNDLPSMTVPDMSMSLEDIIKRSAQGLDITGNPNEPIYEEFGSGIDPRTLDLTELAEAKAQANMRIKQIKDEWNTMLRTAQEEAAKKRQEEFDKAVEAKIAAASKTPSP